MLTPDTHIIKRALISVSDKNGIVEFAKGLAAHNIELISTGGTAQALKDAGLEVKKVSDITGFPEILDGRVKTLHPAIHAGLLADLGKQNHIEQMTEHGLDSIDILVVNLYPFEETLKRSNATHTELIENIDIGGPGMLRAAAKNYKWTAPVVNPQRYQEVLESLDNNGCTIKEDLRVKLAGDVFSHTSYYDALIAGYFNKYNEIEMPDKTAVPLKSELVMRYGENPHQDAKLFGSFHETFNKLHGKDLSYNNIIDIDAASKLILEFDDAPTVAIIKHTNPCGVGRGNDLIEAYDKAFATDNVSPFGGIIAVNKPMDKAMAEHIHGIFTEVLIAPAFTDEALEVLTKKRDRRLLTVNYQNLKGTLNYDLKSVAGGYLMQKTDTYLVDRSKLEFVTKRKPTEEELKAMMFGWIVCKHVKSNAIVYTSHDRTLAIGAGQMSRVDSSRIAVEKAKLMGLDLKGSICASDAFFPFPDGLIQAADAGATAVIQPGGSVRDEEVIKAADERGIAMVLTKGRHFRH